MTEPARQTYSTLAKIEARHTGETDPTTATQELTALLDELDQLRALQDVVGLG